MKFDAVLFDLDGTLVHTTHLYQDAVIDAMTSIGLMFTRKDFERLYPLGTTFSEWILQFGGTEEMIPALRKARDEAYEALLRKNAEFIEGVEALFGSIRHRPSGIVTGSWQSYVDAIDEKLGIKKHVPLIVTADDMDPFHKPHPHGLLLAADSLNVDPKKCIYIGDQGFDLAAAKAAGMTSCFIPGTHSPKGIEKGADISVGSIAELLEVL